MVLIIKSNSKICFIYSSNSDIKLAQLNTQQALARETWPKEMSFFPKKLNFIQVSTLQIQITVLDQINLSLEVHLVVIFSPSYTLNSQALFVLHLHFCPLKINFKHNQIIIPLRTLGYKHKDISHAGLFILRERSLEIMSAFAQT